MIVRLASLFIFITSSFYAYGFFSKTSPVDDLVFLEEVSDLKKDQVDSISQSINLQLENLKKLCVAKPQLKTVKQFINELKKLGNYADTTYNQNSFSLNNIKIKEGKEFVNLGIYLLDLSSILKYSAFMNYPLLLKSSDLKETCKNLKNNYELSYATHYNLKDNVSIQDSMTFGFKKINDSINCVCK